MSPKRWILLLVFYISYLMFGASIYYHLEHGLERQRRANELKERIEINAYLLDQLSYKNETDQDEILERISDYCGRPVTDYRTDQYEIPYTWTFYHSFFFAFTVCSTVGYGNISPSTTLGQMIMIAYSIIGIPVNGILFAGLGEYFGLIFQSIYHRYKKYKMSTDIHYMPPKLSLITTVLIALIPGITMFLLIPSWVFSYFENWPFTLALYYAYVTTTTIGFGDYVPTFQPHQHREFGAWFIVYQIFIIIWFIFSLGYLLMIMTFITRGLQSKKLAHLEQQLSMNIKSTQNRIWTGVTRDVNYIRRIFNELYLMKYKPIYSESITARCGHRSISCPNLTVYDTDEQFKSKRKRAASECFEYFARTEGTPFSFNSISDTEVNKIDRQKSFETAEAFRQTTNLLFKVVDALASVKPPSLDDALYLCPNATGDTNTMNASSGGMGGYHGFSDSEILSSELWSANDELPGYYYYPRQRACSDFNVEPKWKQLYRHQTNHSNEWTWSGDNNQIQEAINKRCKQNSKLKFNPKLSTLESVITIENNNHQQHQMGVQDHMKRKFAPRKSIIPESFTKWISFKRLRLLSTTDNHVEADRRKFSATSLPEEGYHISSISPSIGDLNQQPLKNIQSSTQQWDIKSNDHHQQQQKPPQQQQDNNIGKNSLGSMCLRNLLINKYKNNDITNKKDYDRRRLSNCSNIIQYQRNRSIIGGEGPSRRPSDFSYASQYDTDILETTTVADLIRALETFGSVDPKTDASNIEDKTLHGNKLKEGMNISFEKLLTSLLGIENEKIFAYKVANRLYNRRFTVSTFAPINSTTTTMLNNTGNNSNIPNILTRRRRCTTIQTLQPPICNDLNDDYNSNQADNIETSKSMEEQTNNNCNWVPSSTNSSFKVKFKRRFSVRPTNLQTPLRQDASNNQQPLQLNDDNINKTTITSSTIPLPAGSITINSPQTVLQRRYSLRPSPLARTNTTSNAGLTTATNRSGRFLPSHMIRSTNGSSSSSTHSPLSRIVQISEAHRKSSMPDGFHIDTQTNITNK